MVVADEAVEDAVVAEGGDEAAKLSSCQAVKLVTFALAIHVTITTCELTTSSQMTRSKSGAQSPRGSRPDSWGCPCKNRYRGLLDMTEGAF